MDLLRVHSQDLHDHIAQEVGECLESGLYTDLAIRCAQGQTLHAHRLVLAAVSPYLQMVILHFSIARITLQLKKEKSNHFFSRLQKSLILPIAAPGKYRMGRSASD